MPENNTEKNNKTFASKALINWSILIGLVGLIWLFVATFNISLLFFGGLLIAILIVALSKRLEKMTGWKRWLTTTLSILLSFGVLGLLIWLIGATLQNQFNELSSKLPEMISKAKEYLKDSSIGTRVLDSIYETGDNVNLGSMTQKIFKSTFGVFGDIYAVLFLGIFLAVTPKEYYTGTLKMFPTHTKQRARELIGGIYFNLKTWLKSQLLEMLVMFVLTAAGLLILGIDLWLILALIAALLCFIPNIGPVLAVFPMVLVGFLDGPSMALWVFITFMIIQLIETGAIGPYIRKKMLSLPPALVLFFQLVLGSLTGMWGILLATPMLLVIIIFIKYLYLGEKPTMC